MCPGEPPSAQHFIGGPILAGTGAEAFVMHDSKRSRGFAALYVGPNINSSGFITSCPCTNSQRQLQRIGDDDDIDRRRASDGPRMVPGVDRDGVLNEHRESKVSSIGSVLDEPRNL